VSKKQRDKGLLGEREVRTAFVRAGLGIKNLELGGDNLVACADGHLLHIETKRQETLRMDDWSHQAEREAPDGAVPMVCYRRSREPWRVSLRLEDLLGILQRIGPVPSPYDGA
jgi:hypothetical protein